MGDMVGLNKTPFPYKFVNKENLDYVGDVPSARFFNTKEDYISFIKKNKIFNLKKESLEYCKNDVTIVHKVLTEIIKIINNYDKKIINNSFSFSSISYKIYIKKYDKYRVNEQEINMFESNYYKNAYYGGRCEVFGNPEKDDIIHHFDFSGMYGQCMLEKFPVGESFFTESNLNYKKIGFHTIKFKCNNYLPFLPFKSGKLLFPNGAITGTY
jgi:hypothetical protein